MTASNTAKKKQRLKAPILVNSAEVEVMRALRRQGRISRTEISSITGWSKAKASQEIRSLVNKGYLVEVGEGASQGGRSCSSSPRNRNPWDHWCASALQKNMVDRMNRGSGIQFGKVAEYCQTWAVTALLPDGTVSRRPVSRWIFYSRSLFPPIAPC